MSHVPARGMAHGDSSNQMTRLLSPNAKQIGIDAPIVVLQSKET
jgi:hypothetical protein